jgi:hypothetical protein
LISALYDERIIECSDDQAKEVARFVEVIVAG